MPRRENGRSDDLHLVEGERRSEATPDPTPEREPGVRIFLHPDETLRQELVRVTVALAVPVREVDTRGDGSAAIERDAADRRRFHQDAADHGQDGAKSQRFAHRRVEILSRMISSAGKPPVGGIDFATSRSCTRGRINTFERP
jgi:hypothetical protein